MAISDVKVIIDLRKPSALIGLGTPLILADKVGDSTYKEYLDVETIKTEFGESSNVYLLAQKIYDQGDNRPEKIAVVTYDSVAGQTSADVLRSNFYKDWYFVLVDAGDITDLTAISDIVEGEDLKMAVHMVTSTEQLSALKDKEYKRTIAFHHSKPLELPHAALVGGVGSLEVGSVTWKFKTLTGVTPEDLSPTELNTIHAEGGMAYVTKAGVNQTSEGKVVSGEYVDVIHGKDWIKLNLEQQIQYLLSTNPKIPYTNTGIAQIEDTARTVFETAGTMGIIADSDPGQYIYTINTLKRDEVLPSDRANRIYKGLSFSFELAGAIHEVEIKGEILI